MHDTSNEPHRIAQRAESLVDWIRPFERCAVAFSGGVDSAVVAKAARLALGAGAIAITGSSASLAQGEQEGAERLAVAIGIRHRVIATDEMQNSDYRRNDGHRCFHCKDELYGRIHQMRAEENFDVIFSGANQDDLADYRPGLIAAKDWSVRHPLAESGLDKATVRAIARYWNLVVWDKPASPCLSSRLAYGVPVTHDRLQRIDASERFLRQLGFSSLRVRYHEGDHARIELPADQIERLAREPLRSMVTRELARIGFRFISLDLSGFQSGGLNALLQIDSVQPAQTPVDRESSAQANRVRTDA